MEDPLLAYLDQTVPEDRSYAAFKEFLKGCNPQSAAIPETTPDTAPSPEGGDVLPPTSGRDRRSIYGFGARF